MIGDYLHLFWCKKIFGAVRSQDDMVYCVVMFPFLCRVATDDADSPVLSSSTAYVGTKDLTVADVVDSHIVFPKQAC